MLTTACAILRDNGVEIGKRNYLGHTPYREAIWRPIPGSKGRRR
jgi:hypothetical protein